MKKWVLSVLVFLLVAMLVMAIILSSSRLENRNAVPETTPMQVVSIVPNTVVPTNSVIEETATDIPIPTADMPALPPSDAAAERLTVPTGFAIRIFAQDLAGKPRFMAVGPDGQVYISLFNTGSIARLPDRDLDGLSDGTEIVASGLNNPHGLEWNEDWLYVAEIDRVSRLQDKDGDGLLETVEVIINGIPGVPGHTSRTIHFGPDGSLFLSVGSSCNVCAEDDPRRAAILRFNADGSIPADNPFAGDEDPRKRAVWGWGLRNSVDFLWTPAGQMWANHNGRDNLVNQEGNADTLPPEEIIIAVQAGKSHGWPYCYTSTLGFNQGGSAEVLDPQSGLLFPEGFDCSLNQVIPAVFTDLAHSAPLGMSLGDASLNFPAEYQNSLYVAYHGSWNTTASSIRDCKVERVILDGEQPISGEEFVTGWRAPGETCGSPATWGRPADVVVGADGALYISDDKGGRVYRVVYIGE